MIIKLIYTYFLPNNKPKNTYFTQKYTYWSKYLFFEGFDRSIKVVQLSSLICWFYEYSSYTRPLFRWNYWQAKIQKFRSLWTYIFPFFSKCWRKFHSSWLKNWRPWRQLAGIPLSFESLDFGQSSNGSYEYDGVEQES